MITIIKLHELFANLAAKGMKQVFSDWEMLVGFEATSESTLIQIAESVDAVEPLLGGTHVAVETKVTRDEGAVGSIYFAFPNSLVIEVIADLLMIPESARAAKAVDGLSENDVEAFQEMANLLCGSWNRVFQDLERDLRISQSVDDLKVWTGSKESSALTACVGSDRIAYVPLEVSCQGSQFPSLIVMPLQVAIAVAERFYTDAA